MIIYGGTKYINKIGHLVFYNDQKFKVEIPTEEAVIQRINAYLGKISEPSMNAMAQVIDENE